MIHYHFYYTTWTAQIYVAIYFIWKMERYQLSVLTPIPFPDFSALGEGVQILFDSAASTVTGFVAMRGIVTRQNIMELEKKGTMCASLQFR